MAFTALRVRMHCWHGLPTRQIPNNGYRTIGILVPLAEFEKIAIEVISM